MATILGGGTYTLRAPLRLAGEPDSNVAIVGSGAGRPTLSAGIRVPAWRAFPPPARGAGEAETGWPTARPCGGCTPFSA